MNLISKKKIKKILILKILIYIKQPLQTQKCHKKIYYVEIIFNYESNINKIYVF